MNLSLYQLGWKKNWKLLTIFILVITMYVSVVTLLYDPEMSNILTQFSEYMPEMMSAFGMGNIATNLVEFLANYLYGFLLIIFPMVFIIIVSNQLVAKYIDDTSMVYLLASPNSRNKIIRTQIAVLLSLLFSLVLYTTLIGIAASELFFPNELDTIGFIMINIGLFSLLIAMTGICFFFSCIATDTKFSLGASIGITVFFYLMQMLSGMGTQFEFLKYTTLFTLFNPNELLGQSTVFYASIPILLIIGFIFFLLSTLYFKKRDLSI